MYTVPEDDLGFIQHVYVGNQTPYEVPFRFHDFNDLHVEFLGALGSKATLDYEVDFESYTIAGVINIDIYAQWVPPESSGVIEITRVVAVQQPLAIPPGKEVPRKPLEYLLDRIVWMIQAFRRGAEDQLVYPPGDGAMDGRLPAAEQRKDGVFTFDSEGLPSVYHPEDRLIPSEYMGDSYQQISNSVAFRQYHMLDEIKALSPHLESRLFQQLMWEDLEGITTIAVVKLLAAYSKPERDISGSDLVAYIFGENNPGVYDLYLLGKDRSFIHAGLPHFVSDPDIDYNKMMVTVDHLFISGSSALLRVKNDFTLLYPHEADMHYSKVVYGETEMECAFQFGSNTIGDTFFERYTTKADDENVFWNVFPSFIPERVQTAINTERRMGAPLFVAFGTSQTWSSNDGRNWSPLSALPSTSIWVDAIYSDYYNGYLVMGIENDNEGGFSGVRIKILHSLDLTNWTTLFDRQVHSSGTNGRESISVHEDFGGISCRFAGGKILIHYFGKYSVVDIPGEMRFECYVPSFSAFMAATFNDPNYELSLSKNIDPLTFPPK